LVAAGHNVLLAYTSTIARNYTEEAAGLGVQAFHDDPEATHRDARSQNFRSTWYFGLDRRWEAAEQLASESDLVIVNFLALPAMVAAISIGKPFIILDYFPMLPSAELPPYWNPSLNGVPAKIAWWINRQRRERLFRDALIRLCGLAGISFTNLSRLEHLAAHRLVAISPSLIKRPVDWQTNVELCGFIDSPQRYDIRTIPPELVKFISNGEAPIFFTFGSTPIQASDVQAIIQAIRRSGRRGILHLPESSVSINAGHDMFLIRKPISHQEVFPSCIAIVHHGGAGTTYAALRSGVPSVIISYWMDQPFWGEILHRKGLGPPRLSRNRLMDKDLDRCIRIATEDHDIRHRVRIFAGQLRTEDGVTSAIALLQAHGLLDRPQQTSGS
jgi:sterol 3beta-glucosyltransferase